MSYFVGLTGGIGSGKSTVATLFSDLGVPVVDTDTISHQLTQADGTAIHSIRTQFGDVFINAQGALDRVKMRELVFSDATARQSLEHILHPLILAQAKAQAEASPAPYVLLVIPLLFETNSYQMWLDHTVTVDCTEEAQINRATKRSGLSRQTVLAIMAQQLPRTQRVKLATDIISNDGDLIDLHKQVSQLHLRLLNLATRRN